MRRIDILPYSLPQGGEFFSLSPQLYHETVSPKLREEALNVKYFISLSQRALYPIYHINN